METRKIDEMDLLGGHPALDFVNTLAGLRSTGPLPDDEHLRAYGDLLTFGVRSGTLPEADAGRLGKAAQRDPARAGAALRAAHELRAVIEAVFRPLAEGSRPSERALGDLHQADGVALRGASLEPAEAGYRWSWGPASKLESPLWPLAHGAVELLTSEAPERLKICGRCRWLFLDASKNHSRRWCSMEGCGTDTKKERYVSRRRERRAAR